MSPAASSLVICGSTFGPSGLWVAPRPAPKMSKRVDQTSETSYLFVHVANATFPPIEDHLFLMYLHRLSKNSGAFCMEDLAVFCSNHSLQGALVCLYFEGLVD